jgi:hypothetical protein
LQLAITHGSPLPPNRFSGEASRVQQQAKAVYQEVFELCRQILQVVNPVITLRLPLANPTYLAVVFDKRFKNDLTFLPVTRALISSQSPML